MIDCETLGTTSDAVVMSIGAVKFDLHSKKTDDEGFYASISIESNLELGRRIAEDTLIWWMGQAKEAQGVFHEPKVPLCSALKDLTEWLGEDPGSLHVWSNGADFDIPMLSLAYAQAGLETPWKFFKNRCFRTFKNLPFPPAYAVNREGPQHNALFDAIYQAKVAQSIQASISKAKVAA